MSRLLSACAGKCRDHLLHLRCHSDCARQESRSHDSKWWVASVSGSRFLPHMHTHNHTHILSIGVDTTTCGLIATPETTLALEKTATKLVESKKSELTDFRETGCGVDRKFRAMTSLEGKKNPDHDQHGFMSMICCHGLVLCSIMMSQHECFLFSIMLLTLLQQHLSNPQMVLLLYDVMCRAAPYLFAHMGDLFIRYVGNPVISFCLFHVGQLYMCAALPVWHAMAHIPECSSRFNSASILVAGDIDGEQTVRIFHHRCFGITYHPCCRSAFTHSCASLVPPSNDKLHQCTFVPHLAPWRLGILSKRCGSERTLTPFTESC